MPTLAWRAPTPILTTIHNRRINVSVRSQRKRLVHGKPVFTHVVAKWFSVDFKGPAYDTAGSGIFKDGTPHVLTDGRVSTGEYTTVDNQTSNPIEHEIEKTVEESESSSITLAESLELKSGTTVGGRYRHRQGKPNA